MIAQRLLPFALQDGHGGKYSRGFQDLIADRAAFRTVTIQERIRGAGAARDQREFPGEIAGVLNAGVHALAAGRTVNVRGITSQKNAAAAVVADFAFVDVKIREPDGIRNFYATGTALVENRLNFFEGGLGAHIFGVGESGVGDDSEAAGSDGKNNQDAGRMPEGVGLVGIGDAGKVHVGEHPVAGLGAAGKLHAEPGADRAVRAVATD